MPEDRLLAIGLDMGTGGARAVAVDLSGELVAGGRADLPAKAARVDGPCVVQDPQAWTQAARTALGEVSAALTSRHRIVGIAVDATSGTFLLADERGQPLTPGIMYNDLRATDEAPAADEALRDDLAPYGIRIAASFALPKIVHLARSQPELFARFGRVLHQTDWIVGMLSGRYDVTDVSSALKTGADPGSLTWPAAIEEDLGIPRHVLPQIVLPGVPIGEVTAEAAASMGLPAGIPVVSGCTDGTAGCLASGAREVGNLNVTLGTTLVFKAIAETPLIDPAGALYNHRHPAGGFLPGAASSAGGDWIPKYFPHADLDHLGREAARVLPAQRIVYPLVKTGERFPFACPSATGFGLDEITSPAERFAAGMEGVACLERMGIQCLERLGLEVSETIYATGGGAASATWLRIRASANRRVYTVPEQPECAVGAAVLAAVPHVGDCSKAIGAMVRLGRQVQPDPELASAYDEGFERFQDALRERGYL